MGFFKRLLSAGSKRNKKKSSAKEEVPDLRRYHSQTLPVLSEVESEAAANRLLRTASSRLGAMRYGTGDEPLPPLPNPHPEADEKAETRSLPFLPNPHPLISPAEMNTQGALSPRSTVLELCPTPEPQREPTPPPRTTYVVKVYERTVISRTEFPNAIPSLATPTKERAKSVPLPETDPGMSDNESIGPSTAKHPTITPRDQNRLMRLRQDPSVVSLLNMYDSNGQLDNKVFSNTPAKDSPSEEEVVYAVGQPQHRRRESTLRQLMGKTDPEAQPNNSRSEGEISWAERLLRERKTSSTSLATASSSAGVRTPQDSNFGQGRSYEHEHTTSQDYDSYQRQESVVSTMETEASANHPIVDVAAPIMETYPLTPGRAAGVFEFLTERRKQQESRPLPSIPAFNSRPPSFDEYPPSPQEDLSLEQSQYVRVSQELDSIFRLPGFNEEESSIFDPNASPTPIIGNPQIPQRIDSWRPKMSLDDRLLRGTTQVDQENPGSFTAVPSRELRRKSSYTDANKAFIMSPVRGFGNDVVNGKPPIPVHLKALSAYENQENDWSLQGLAPATPKKLRAVTEWYSAGGTSIPVSPASSTEMSPLGQQIMANVRRKRYGH